MIDRTGVLLADLSRWIDDHNEDRDPEAATWGRLAKIQEEAGEVVAAYIGYTGQNPRKGITHRADDVLKELLDVAITALAAAEHIDGNRGHSIHMLMGAVIAVHERAGLDEGE